MPKQRPAIIGVIVILLIAVIGGGAWYISHRSQPNTTQTSKKKRITAPINELPLAERPVVLLETLDSRNIQLSVQTLKKPAQSMEYELEYQAGSLLQGAFGSIELGSLPAQEKILLGSCSAGGACTYHQDVKGGSLVGKFASDDAPYVLKSDWKYIENTAKESAVSSKDAKFQFNSPALAKQAIILIFNGFGYPAGLEGTPISDPYMISTSSTVSGEGELTIRANEEGATAIMGWDGSTWKTFAPSKVDGKSVTATVPFVQMYIVVK